MWVVVGTAVALVDTVVGAEFVELAAYVHVGIAVALAGTVVGVELVALAAW